MARGYAPEGGRGLRDFSMRHNISKMSPKTFGYGGLVLTHKGVSKEDILDSLDD
jgi:hypothetical protein